MVRITKEILEKMRELRKKGFTYREISTTLGVSKWSCIRYLKNIEVKKSAIEEEWRKAEEEAITLLKKKGFKEIHNLNKIAPSPYWDILAKKDNKWWLIDVTISSNKTIGAKIPYTTNGYIHAILYKDINTLEWKLVKLSLNVE